MTAFSLANFGVRPGPSQVLSFFFPFLNKLSGIVTLDSDAKGLGSSERDIDPERDRIEAVSQLIDISAANRCLIKQRRKPEIEEILPT